MAVREGYFKEDTTPELKFDQSRFQEILRRHYQDKKPPTVKFSNKTRDRFGDYRSSTNKITIYYTSTIVRRAFHFQKEEIMETLLHELGHWLYTNPRLLSWGESMGYFATIILSISIFVPFPTFIKTLISAFAFAAFCGSAAILLYHICSNWRDREEEKAELFKKEVTNTPFAEEIRSCIVII